MNYEKVTMDEAWEWFDSLSLPKESDEWNWFEALRLKTLPGSELHLIMAELSEDWTTCACGQLCKALPRRDGGAPDDSLLFNLGSKFNKAVVEADWDWATVTLNKIEARSAELLASLPRS